MKFAYYIMFMEVIYEADYVCDVSASAGAVAGTS
jgi:hypothetical protein